MALLIGAMVAALMVAASTSAQAAQTTSEASIQRGDSTTASIDLSDEGVAGPAHLQYKLNGAWHTFPIHLAIQDGVATHTWSPSGTRTYRFTSNGQIFDTFTVRVEPIDLTYYRHDASIDRGDVAEVTVRASHGGSGSGVLQYSRDGRTWGTSSIGVEFGDDGKANIQWRPSSTRYYRVNAFGASTGAFRIYVAQPARYSLSSSVSANTVKDKEAVWVTGVVKDRGSNPGATRVRIQQRTGGSWFTVTTLTTWGNGSFRHQVNPSRTTDYRVVALPGTSSQVIGPALTVTASSGSRTLEERRQDVAWRLGSPTSSIKNLGAAYLSKADYPGGATAGRYQFFQDGMLVEVTNRFGTRTWMVLDDIETAYRNRHWWGGSLGLPFGDVTCGYLESGCLQQFSGGAVYENGSSMSPGTYVAYGAPDLASPLAAAYSQAGYEEPSWRSNKYNSWIGDNNAWCSVFVTWSFYASGQGSKIPYSSSYPSFVNELRSRGVLDMSPSTAELEPGDVVLFDWGTGTPSHAAMVRSVSGGSTLFTIEGNTTDGSGDPQRGVYMRTRGLSSVWATYSPRDL
ncbi:hypothetical protein Dac01nite_20740 [Demequina activiva]|uniref:Peptidase C51 domain-containing protein n=1 Tax=Demequina activiva TaxID=1582364 RepID=A0A919Q526_9MICO|nr:hypothetical protein Dac01nite_20740 [Demequina activiva]